MWGHKIERNAVDTISFLLEMYLTNVALNVWWKSTSTCWLQSVVWKRCEILQTRNKHFMLSYGQHGKLTIYITYASISITIAIDRNLVKVITDGAVKSI